MTQDITIEEINKLIGHVKRGQLKAALELARKCATSLRLWNYLDNISQHERTYKAMAKYLTVESDSQERHKALANIKEDLLRLSDALRLTMDIDKPRAGRESDLYTAMIRTREFRKSKSVSELIADIESVTPDDQYFDLINDLFSVLLTTQHLSKFEIDAIDNLLSEYQLDITASKMVVSALGLANLYYYDRYKLLLLLNNINIEDEDLHARLLTGIFLSLWRHPARISLDPEIMILLEKFFNDSVNKNDMQKIAMAFVASRDTERINEKMQNDIIPELKKLQSDFTRRFSGSTDIQEILDPGKNPEWEDLMKKSGLSDSIRELGEMQSQGGDVMMFAFSNLKNFNFFNNIGNWLLPFSANHPDLRDLSQNNGTIMEIIEASTDFLCDSDKFSLCLAMKHMPSGKSEFMVNQMRQQFEQYKEEKNSSLKKSLEKPLYSRITLYVRSLSRLINLFPHKGLRLPNPFSKAILPSTIPNIGKFFKSDSEMKIMGEFLFSRGYYDEVFPVLMQLAENNPQDPLLMEKIGYAMQQTGDTVSALKYYTKAEALSENPSKWLLRKLASLYHSLGNLERSIQYWEMLSKIDPDNTKITLHLANVLFDAGDLQKSLKQYYKANYLDGDSTSYWRPIAWCEFRLGNLEKSQGYYDRLVALDENASDFINAGHLALSRGRIDNALELYQRAAKHHPKGATGIIELLQADAAIIEEFGFDKETQEILYDRIAYEES